MDPIFTIPYSEYRAIEIFNKHFKKKDGYFAFIPVSRQQKGIDFCILKKRKNKKTECLTIQVKSSRTYFSKEAKTKKARERHKFILWFNVFPVPDEADLFVFVGLFPEHEVGKRVTHVLWEPVCLVFTGTELKEFMKNLKTKSGKTESKFTFGFDSNERIYLRRGTEGGNFVDYTKSLLENKVDFIKHQFFS